MCGIVGYLSFETIYTPNITKYFRQALFADTVRGKDSTGVFGLNNKTGKVDTFKRAVEAVDFLNMKQFLEMEHNAKDYLFMVGHNRWATQGGLGNEQAHPFKDNHITMVHNGTLFDHYSLVDGKNYDVDSEAICHSLSVDGTKKTIETLDGAFALVWYDENTKELCIVRNKERPLSIGYVEGEDTMLFASEQGMLQWLAERNKFKLSDIYTPEVGTLHKWKIDPNTDITKPKVEKFKLYEPLYKTYTYGYGGTTKSSGKKSYLGKTLTTKSGKAVGPGDEVELLALEFFPYSSSKSGDLGYIDFQIEEVKETNAYGRLHNVSKTDWEDMYDNVYFARINHIQQVNKDIIAVLWQDGITFLAQEDYYSDGDTDDVDEDKSLSIYKGPNNKMLTFNEFKEATADGCALCGMSIRPDDDRDTGWSEKGEPYCKSCMHDMAWDWNINEVYTG